MLKLDNRTARRLFLDRHALLEPPSGPAKGADLLALIERLGFVQLDSINTMARAHDLILFSRRPAYRPGDLKRLYERDKGLFEHWTHDAAVIPMAFYPHWKLRFQRDEQLLANRWRKGRRDGFEAQFKPVLEHIRDHGPVTSGDVGTDEPKASGGWWDWHPSKTALEYLWRSGALTVVGRNGFQKRYDLTERVIEETLHSGPAPDAKATINWLCAAALDRLGFATSGELAAFWDTATPAEAKSWTENEAAAGRLIPLEIECHSGKPRRLWARPDIEAATETLAEPTGRLRVLSPFDPALRDRNRAERLFGFHYRIEVFVPAPKRLYGYYVFPLMEGDRLIGRIDMKTDRARDSLHIRALWPEPGIRFGKGRLEKLDAELTRCARLAGVSHLTHETDWLR